MTDQQKIDEIIRILQSRYRRNALLTDRDIMHQIKFKVHDVLRGLIEIKEGKREGKRLPIEFSFPPDIWGAVLEAVKREGEN